MKKIRVLVVDDSMVFREILSRGLLAMKRKGARTIGQDEKSSVVYGMPKVAYDLGAVDKQTSIENIGTTLMNML